MVGKKLGGEYVVEEEDEFVDEGVAGARDDSYARGDVCVFVCGSFAPLRGAGIGVILMFLWCVVQYKRAFEGKGEMRDYKPIARGPESSRGSWLSGVGGHDGVLYKDIECMLV